MAPEPNPDRLRLVIEPDSDDTRVLSAEDVERQGRDDLVELERLADDSDYEFEDEEEPESRRRVLPAGLAVMAILGFVAVSWFAYQSVVGVQSEEAIPLIQADAGPIKTRPTAPGGLEVPHQDKLVLNEITPDPQKPQVERLLPPPEVPKPPVAAAPVQEPVVQGKAVQEQAVQEPGSATAGVTVPGQEQPAAGGEDIAAALPLATAAGPKTEPAAAPAQAPAIQAPAAPAPTPQTAAAAPKAAPAAPPAPAVPAPESLAPAAKAAPKVPAPATTQTAALTEGYLVQLASLKDKSLIGGEWVRLQKAFPSILDKKKLVLQTADLGAKGVYHRLRVGYFKDKASAGAACQAFKARNQACIVVRP